MRVTKRQLRRIICEALSPDDLELAVGEQPTRWTPGSSPMKAVIAAMKAVGVTPDNYARTLRSIADAVDKGVF